VVSQKLAADAITGVLDVVRIRGYRQRPSTPSRQDIAHRSAVLSHPLPSGEEGLRLLGALVDQGDEIDIRWCVQ
jgi:hypothetical protein